MVTQPRGSILLIRFFAPIPCIIDTADCRINIVVPSIEFGQTTIITDNLTVCRPITRRVIITKIVKRRDESIA